MTPTQVADLILRTRTDSPISETATDVIFKGAFLNSGLVAEWRALRANPPAFVDSVIIRPHGSDDELSDHGDPAPADEFQFALVKRSVADELRLFFGSTIGACASEIEACSCIQVADMRPQEVLSTYRARFQPWSSSPADTYAPWEPLKDPRFYSKDFSGAGAVPSDARPWLLRSRPLERGETYSQWSQLALRRLLAIIADQVSKEGSNLKYHFNGPPTQDIIVSDGEMPQLEDALQDGVRWVFSEGRDTDTRHLLLANEWARSYRHDSLRDFSLRALESAKAGYEAYVNSSSRETLKALAELRKSVIDEAQKISQRAQDLTTALWKDVAIAATPFVLKVLSDATSVPSHFVATGLAFGAAIFLVFSYYIQGRINGRFFERQKEARETWRKSLNTVLTSANLQNFSEEPISKSITDYREARRTIGYFYMVLVVILLAFALFQIENPKASPSGTSVSSGVTSGQNSN